MPASVRKVSSFVVAPVRLGFATSCVHAVPFQLHVSRRARLLICPPNAMTFEPYQPTDIPLCAVGPPPVARSAQEARSHSQVWRVVPVCGNTVTPREGT